MHRNNNVRRPRPKLQLPQPHPLKSFLFSNLGIATSIAFHAAIILLALATYQVGKTVIAHSEEQIIVPDELIVDGAPVGGIPNPGLGGDPTRAAASDHANDTPNDVWVRRPNQALEATIMGGLTDSTTDSAIGTGVRSLGAADPGGAADPSAPFGVPGGGGGLGPKSTFMGLSGNARRIVYVCDASGSMVGRMESLMQELERSVNRLQAVQGFNALFFGHRTPIAFGSDLTAANQIGKQRLERWLLNITHGRAGSDPVPCLRLAFSERAQLIYLLTDGAFTGPEGADAPAERVINEIRRLNRDKRVKINTIAFTSRQPDKDEDYIKTLAQIATENGGRFRVVTPRDLQEQLEPAPAN